MNVEAELDAEQQPASNFSLLSSCLERALMRARRKGPAQRRGPINQWGARVVTVPIEWRSETGFGLWAVGELRTGEATFIMKQCKTV